MWSLRATSALFVSKRARATRPVLLLPSVRLPVSGWRRRAALRRSQCLRRPEHLLDDSQHLDEMARLECEAARLRDTTASLQRLRQLVETEGSDGDGSDLRRQIERTHDTLCNLDDSVCASLATMPNLLHTNTPVSRQDRIIPLTEVDASGVHCPSVDTSSMTDSPSVDISPRKTAGGAVEAQWPPELVEASVAGTVFLHGDAALAECALQEAAINHTLTDSTSAAARVSCADTVSAAVAEACYGMQHQHMHIETARLWRVLLHNTDRRSDTCLVGGASLPAVCATFARCSLHRDALPMRLVTAGRQYVAVEGTEATATSPPHAVARLAEAAQSTVVRSLSLTADTLACCREFDRQLARQTALVRALCDGRHLPACGVTVRHVAAARLAPSESRRVELHVHAPLLPRAVCVAHVAQLDDYVARRLHVARSEDGGERAIHMVDCVVLHVGRMLACLLAEDESGALCVAHWPSVITPFLP